MGAKRTRRSPEEILAEKREALERAEQRAAIQAAKDHPASNRILYELGEMNKSLSLARRGFVKGRQNFENRIKSHQLWIAEIEAERNHANIEIAYTEEIRDNLSDLLNATVERIRLGEDVTAEESMNAINEIVDKADDMFQVNFAVTETEYLEAKEARKAFTDSLKPKDKEEDPPEQTASA